MNIDQNVLIRAALLVGLLGIFILTLTYVIPVLGILGAIAIAGLLLYGGYLILQGKFPPK